MLTTDDDMNEVITWRESLQTNQGPLNFVCVQKVEKNDCLYRHLRTAAVTLPKLWLRDTK